MLADVFFAGVLRRVAGNARPWVLEDRARGQGDGEPAPLPGRDADRRDFFHYVDRRGVRDGLYASAATALAVGATGARCARQGADAYGPGDSLRLWANGSVGDVEWRIARKEVRRVARGVRLGHGGAANEGAVAWRRQDHGQRVHCAQGRDDGVHANVLLVAGKDSDR